MQRSSVVLPEPERPNRAVMPCPGKHGYLHKFENRLKMGGMDLKICDLNLG